MLSSMRNPQRRPSARWRASLWICPSSKSTLSELNGEINRRYQELGQFIYEAKKAGTADETNSTKRSPVWTICTRSSRRVSAQLAGASEQSHLPVLRQADGDRRDVLQSLRHEADKGQAPAEEPAAQPEQLAEAPEQAPAPEKEKDGGIIPPARKVKAAGHCLPDVNREERGILFPSFR